VTLPADPLVAVERACVGEEVASVARHELRNRLASIRNACFYIRRRVQGTELWTDDPRIEQFFALIEDAIVGSDRVAEERLTLRHLHSARVEPVSVRSCVERAIACTRVRGAAAIEASGDGTVLADASELAVAVRCLVENAIEAGGDMVRVRVECHRIDAPGADSATTAAPAGAPGLELRVIDDGPGIPAELRTDVTRSRFTTKPGHAGLGLSIAARVARRYQGDLSIADVPRGTSITMSFPAVGAEVGGSADPTRAGD
jgi:signal transduction histidine kinase